VSDEQYCFAQSDKQDVVSEVVELPSKQGMMHLQADVQSGLLLKVPEHPLIQSSIGEEVGEGGLE